jgi:hypothetical protein
MNSLRLASALVLLCAGLTANAQVHRCGDSNVYTDKPCAGAEAVDVRSNLLDAGPRTLPPLPPQTPSPPLVLKGVSRVVSSPPSPSSSAWQAKDARDAAETGRTTGMFTR